MPRYFLDVVEGTHLKCDEDGIEAPTNAVAEIQAYMTAGKIASKYFVGSANSDLSVQLLDARRKRVMTVKLSMRTTRGQEQRELLRGIMSVSKGDKPQS